MINRRYLLGFFSLFFITTIFAERSRVFWDFGVIIKKSVQEITPKKSIESLSNSNIGIAPQDKALIADSFIPPTLASQNEKDYDPPIFLEYLDKIPLNNINQVKLLASRLTIQINFQSIIDIVSQIDLSQIDESDCLDLNYWLANAYLNTGKYIEAEDLILKNMALTIDERFHFLLALTYESQGRIEVARKQYLSFIKQFPKSDYKVTALIKTRMLGRR